jgi:separase
LQLVSELKSMHHDIRQDTQTGPVQKDDEHVILVLDKTVQMLPWESIPSLRGRSVSRLPSLSFLRDRLTQLSGDESTVTADGDSLAYVLNPGGDLVSTEKKFRSMLER